MCEEVISVIMSTYNENIEHLDLAIKSILNQTYKNIEFIIIIDNPNNINLIKSLESYDDKRIKLIKNEQNIGLTASLNKAIGIAKGKYIARMDADDISEEDRIEKQIRFLINNNFDIVTSDVLRIDEKGQIINNKSENIKMSILPELILSFRNIFYHPTWLCRKEVYIKLNGYRDIRFAEDYDFICRAMINKFRLGVICENLLKYRIRNDGISNSNKYEQYLSAVKIRFAYKNCKGNLDIYNELLMTDINIYEQNNIKKFHNIKQNFNKKRFIELLNLCLKSKIIRNELMNCIYIKRYIK